jgi:hypothetical protein
VATGAPTNLADVRVLVERALAKTTPRAKADQLLVQALTAAEFPKAPSFYDSVYPLPGELTPAQQLVAEASCHDRFDKLPDDLYAMPYQKPWSMLRWSPCGRRLPHTRSVS